MGVGESGPIQSHHAVCVIWTQLALEDEPADVAARALLTDDEAARATRFRFARDRSRFVQRRAFRRLVLADILGIPARDVVIEADALGAPSVASASGLAFGASSSGDLAVVACSYDVQFGVDLEVPRPIDDPARLLWSISSEEEKACRQEMLGGSALDRLYRVWIAKEAVLKALRVGLQREPSTLTYIVGQGGAELVSAASTAPGIGTWRIHRARLHYGGMLAVAAPAEVESLSVDIRSWGCPYRKSHPDV